MRVEVRRLGPGDDAVVAAAGALFDHPPDAEATARFLGDPHHHLLIAYEESRPIGFVSGVEVTHPDKGTEMFLYELSVDERFRRQGVGRALVEGLDALAHERGCYGMWVITDVENEAARATYSSAGGTTSPPQVMIDWEYDD